jgi:branched-chain amino acid transport system ATP-binding protein
MIQMLQVRDLVVHYGGIRALDGISINVPPGKIVTLIGANGAGKSTTLNAICRTVRLTSGTITYDGKDVTRMNTRQMVELGVTLVPEGRHVFPDLTVMDNLRLGAFLRNGRAVDDDIAHMQELFPILKQRAGQLAGTLSGGEQQMLALARALVSRPRLLMLDEPSLGLAPLIIKSIFSVIKRLNQEDGMTILLVEQNANVALKIADYGYVLETGRIGLEGTGQELLANERVKDMYLGREG